MRNPCLTDYTIPFLDDVAVKGPPTTYPLPDGTPETIPENPGIRRFIWEHFGNINRVVTRIKYSGGTFSALKSTLCAEEITVVGHRCTPRGRLPDESRVSALQKWGPCKNLSEVRAFLGTVGVCRIFIRNFARRAAPLISLTRKDVPFTFGPDQIESQEDLKQALLSSPALRAINYDSSSPVILAVDTSWIAIGFHLCQCDENNPRIRYYNRFGSITLNDREQRFSQAKLEIYGLFRSLQALRLYLIGVRTLVVEVDARYIKGMLNNPDLAPNAAINRWIMAILTFHFKLVHVPGSMHGPDGLSRRPPQPNDTPQPDDDFDDWIDRLHGFVHIVNPALPKPLPRENPLISTFLTASIQSQEESPPPPDSYDLIPCNDSAIKDDLRILSVEKFLQDLDRPPNLSNDDYETFIKYATGFFLSDNRLWKRNTHGAHKLVVPPHDRWSILRSGHDSAGHRGIWATRQLISERFWWPSMNSDVAWFVKTCHPCQQRQHAQVLIPPVVAPPAPLFAKAYIDTMHMPASNGFHYIVQARCSLTHYPEFRMLRKENAKSIGDWIYEDILCRWGGLSEIVTDNGAPFLKALDYLSKRYHINHIRISGYNSRANGLVERPHFDVRQAISKATDTSENKWSQATYSVFWSEHITIRRRMGCSPYFAVTGTHPLLPFDVSEATYLQPPPESTLTTTDLIARRAIALQKRQEDLEKLTSDVYAARVKAAIKFEQDHAASIKDFDFKKGDLVLIRNTQIEKSLNRKMRPRYLGPLIVMSRNRGGAYIVCELDGTVLDRPIAAFRVIPYFARRSIQAPNDIRDISTARLREMELSTSLGDDDPVLTHNKD